LFRARRANVVNWEPGPDTSWKPNYPGSDIFSWSEKNKGVAVDLVIMGQLRFYSLATATSQFKDPSYRLELDVDQGTASALRRLLETGPLRGTDGARLPILGRTATFSVKLRSIVDTDMPDLVASKPFPFLWDGKGMARRDPLKSFPVSDLVVGSTLAVETQISSLRPRLLALDTPCLSGQPSSSRTPTLPAPPPLRRRAGNGQARNL
jgi:hypothetical protein